MVTTTDGINRTSIDVQPPQNYTGGNVNLMVSNNGQENLDNFQNWDVIAENQSGNIQYLTYTSNASPGNNE